MDKLPSEILIEIKKYVIFTPKSKEELKESVNYKKK